MNMPKIFALGVFLLLGITMLSGCAQNQGTQTAGQANNNKALPSGSGSVQTNPDSMSGTGSGNIQTNPDSTSGAGASGSGGSGAAAVREFNVTAKTWEFEPSTITVNMATL